MLNDTYGNGQQNLPKTLTDIVWFLQQENITLSHTNGDGRLNSASDEAIILNAINSKFNIMCGDLRDWFDFGFEENGIFCPINIKLSTLTTADNLNCKLGIYYALTGQDPNFRNELGWEGYFQKLSANMQEHNRDYYFLIINKTNTKDIFAVSLKGLNILVPNGNNLPFQANWNNNRQHVPRSFIEARTFLLSHFEESLRLRAKAHLYFQKYFDDNA